MDTKTIISELSILTECAKCSKPLFLYEYPCPECGSYDAEILPGNITVKFKDPNKEGLNRERVSAIFGRKRIRKGSKMNTIMIVSDLVIKVECANCHEPLVINEYPPCPKCGSLNAVISLPVTILSEKSKSLIEASSFSIDRERELMIKRIHEFSNESLERIWEALAHYDPKEFYAPGINMDEWAQAIYCEMHIRGISAVKIDDEERARKCLT